MYTIIWQRRTGSWRNIRIESAEYRSYVDYFQNLLLFFVFSLSFRSSNFAHALIFTVDYPSLTLPACVLTLAVDTWLCFLDLPQQTTYRFLTTSIAIPCTALSNYSTRCLGRSPSLKKDTTNRMKSETSTWNSWDWSSVMFFFVLVCKTVICSPNHSRIRDTSSHAPVTSHSYFQPLVFLQLLQLCSLIIVNACGRFAIGIWKDLAVVLCSWLLCAVISAIP